MSACRSRRSLTPRGSSARPETWPPLSAGRGPRQQSPDGAPQPHRREARPDPPPPACWRSATTAPGTSTPLSGRLLRACLTSISTKVETAAAAAFWSGCASLCALMGPGIGLRLIPSGRAPDLILIVRWDEQLQEAACLGWLITVGPLRGHDVPCGERQRACRVRERARRLPCPLGSSSGRGPHAGWPSSRTSLSSSRFCATAALILGAASGAASLSMAWEGSRSTLLTSRVAPATASSS
jgi:hypothetical protein